ncbi:hypothetical protein [Asticcacaulis solisilvae]|uniref:hypothetical protein n=1 Tax=Asticcacaulis solisilvae TaxID=1217274 RepID=UPI003FD6D683
MPRERQINEHDTDRAEALQDKIQDELGSGPSFIQTPEQARKDNLIKKIESEGY